MPSDISDSDLRSILLTVDGKGKGAKEAALEELLKRAYTRGFRDRENWKDDL